MNKRDMIAKGEDLVAKLKALEQYYQRYLSVVPKLEEIDISWTKVARSRLIPRIAALSDEEAEKATFLTEIEKDYEKAVKAIGRFVESAPEELEKAKAAELADHRVEYEALLAAVSAEQPGTTYPLHYTTDKEFTSILDQRKARVAGASSTIEMAQRAIDGSLKGYKDGINILRAQAESYLGFNQRLKARADELFRIERPYVEALAKRAAFFEKVNALRTTPSPLLTVLGQYDASLVKEIKTFQSTLSSRDKAQKAISFADRETAPGQAKEWATASEEEITALDGEYTAIANRVYAIQQRIQEEITQAIGSFDALYQASSSFPAFSLNAAFKGIKREFDAANTAVNPGEPEILFLSKKLNTIREITTRFLPAFHTAEESAKQTLRDTISAERNALAARREQFIRSINDGGFKFSEQETTKLTAFAREIIMGEYLEPHYGTILDTYHQLREQKEQIEAKLQAFDAEGGFIHKHRKARHYAENGTFSTDLANDIEKLGDGSLLSLTAQYIAKDKYDSFLSSLSDNLHLFKPEPDTFNFKGIAAVRGFITSQREHTLDDSIEHKLAGLEKKLDFFDLLSSKGIDARPFLNQPVVIEAVSVLKTIKEERIASALNNMLFCQALMILKTNEIEITSDTIGRLLSNPDNCQLIINQNKYHREDHIGVLAEDTFKAILNDCITTDPAVAKAYHAIKENRASEKYATPGFLMLLKENEILRTLLGSGEERFNQNLPLLLPLLEDLFRSSATFRVESYIKDYLSDDIGKKNLIKRTINDNLLPHNEFLAQLKAANENERIDLPQMGKLMGDLYTFIEDLRAKLTSEEDKQALIKFRKAIIPILLTERSIEEKQKGVETLATEHFQAKKEFLQQLLTGIVKLFQNIISSVLGIRYAPEKPERLEEVKSSTQQAFGAVKAAVSKLREDDAEASDKEGEGEGPHAS